MARDLKDIRVGDRVWVSAKRGNNERESLKTVVKLTPTTILLDGLPQYNRYQRGKKSRYGDEWTYYGIGMSDGSVTFIATRQECAEWDAAQQAQKEKAEADARARAEKEALRDELRGLFDGRMVGIGEAYHTPGAEWNVSLYLTIEGVRKLPELLKALTAEELPSWPID